MNAVLAEGLAQRGEPGEDNHQLDEGRDGGFVFGRRLERSLAGAIGLDEQRQPLLAGKLRESMEGGVTQAEQAAFFVGFSCDHSNLRKFLGVQGSQVTSLKNQMLIPLLHLAGRQMCAGGNQYRALKEACQDE
jgi:hypothetical protein